MMIKTSLPIANFIIGGTEKAGTTSIFTYLAAHPEVCASHIKETNFFREHNISDPEHNLANYSKYFSNCNKTSHRIIMEASPGYLGEAGTVSSRIRELVPDVKLLFILRDPIDRLYSSYNFHVGRLNIPKEVSFEDYVDKCLIYATQNATAAETGLDEWYLKALDYGNYGNKLRLFYDKFPACNIKVLFFEDLRENPLLLMNSICNFLKIDKTFYETYMFNKVNVTFSGRLKYVHRVAMKVNDKAEHYFRRHPTLKRYLVKLYKLVNQKQEGYAPMTPLARLRLSEYYLDSNKQIKRLISNTSNVTWLDM